MAWLRGYLFSITYSLLRCLFGGRRRNWVRAICRLLLRPVQRKKLRRGCAIAKTPEGEDKESSKGAESYEGGSAPCPEARRKHLGHIFDEITTRYKVPELWRSAREDSDASDRKRMRGQVFRIEGEVTNSVDRGAKSRSKDDNCM